MQKIATRVYALIQQCEAYADEQKGDRDKALRYYQGETPDLKAEPNMSSVVSRDVRALIRKVMPTIMRTILSNDRIGEYEPVSPEAEEQAVPLQQERARDAAPPHAFSSGRRRTRASPPCGCWRTC